jgi:DNA repair exonuclease SbcCD ATPase subunit
MGMKLAAVMGIMMLALCGAGWMYYQDTQERIAILNENNAKLETAVATSEAAVASLQADFKKANEELTRVNAEFAAIRQQNNVLSDKLAKHDLAILGSSKPGLVEKLVNRGTINAGRCFELLAGAELTDKEKEAKDGKAFNRECPWLWPGPADTASD